MADLKLARLPDRTPVKLTIIITPDLQGYASLYANTYGVEEPVAELIPAMLSAFLEGDRSYVRARDAASRGQK